MQWIRIIQLCMFKALIFTVSNKRPVEYLFDQFSRTKFTLDQFAFGCVNQLAKLCPHHRGYTAVSVLPQPLFLSPWNYRNNCPHSHGKYRGYHVITTITIPVSNFSLQQRGCVSFAFHLHWQLCWDSSSLISAASWSMLLPWCRICFWCLGFQIIVAIEWCTTASYNLREYVCVRHWQIIVMFCWQQSSTGLFITGTQSRQC